jgi:hypothetical protein
MRRSILHLTELQFATGHSHPVAEDSYYPADLCDICTDVVKAALGDALRVTEKLESPEIAGWDRLTMDHEAPTLAYRERDEPGPVPRPLPRAEL